MQQIEIQLTQRERHYLMTLVLADLYARAGDMRHAKAYGARDYCDEHFDTAASLADKLDNARE